MRERRGERKERDEEEDVGNLGTLGNFDDKNLMELTVVTKKVLFVKYNGIEGRYRSVMIEHGFKNFTVTCKFISE